jgi:4-amino-4-deoxy-L-arabinose transferase-like glycosyltransferase
VVGVQANWRNRVVPSPRSKAWVGVIIGISLYTLLRVATIPPHPESTRGVEHDSAYLTIIARNLLAGRGYVNDAHWLVFLNPDTLPIPYHNANPLYPTLMAVISFASGVNIVYSGFLLSALSSSLLVLAITFMVKFYTGRLGPAMLFGFCGALFPPVLEETFRLGVDGLFVALFFAFIAALIRMNTRWGGLLAGVFLGLAWLTRSQVILALPAVLLYMILHCGWQRGISRFVKIGLIAAMVASPWLIHTQTVWGSPLRSDTPYYLMQDYHVMQDYQQYHPPYPLERYWHSPQLPPGIVSVIKQDPHGFAFHILRGIPKVAAVTLTHWSMAHIGANFPALPKAATIAGILLTAAVLFFCLDRRRLLSPEGLAIGLYALIMLLVFAIRGWSFEIRYFNTLSVLFAIFAAAGCRRAWDTAYRQSQSMALRFSITVLSAVLWLWIVPIKALQVRHEVNRTFDFLVNYRLIAAEVHKRFAKGKPVVVGTKPYFYTLETSSSALSIPHASDQFLLAYMNKYGAEYVLLTQKEMDFWRPAWRLPSSIPQELELIDHIGTAVLFQRKRAQ